MNYYKINTDRLKSDGIDTFAHWQSSTQTVVSDMDVRRILGFDLSPENIQKKYNVTPLTQAQLIAVRLSDKWAMNTERNN